MAIHPMFKQVLLAEDKAENTIGNIIVEGYMGDTPTYTVLEVGVDVKKIQVGNRVYVKFGADSFIVKSDGKQRVLVPEESIVAVISG